MSAQFKELLTDQQLRDASNDQLTDLVIRIDIALQRRGEPGIALREADDLSESNDQDDTLDPGTIGHE